MSDIRATIRQLVAGMIKPQQRRGKAVNIDTAKCTCDVDLGNGAMLYAVKLKAIESGATKGRYVVPVHNSYVVAAMVEGVEADWCLVQVSEVDSEVCYFNNGGKLLLKTNGEIHLNGDNLGSLVKIQQVVSKYNILEADLNTVKGAINGWTPVQTDGISLKLALATWLGQAIQLTAVTDLANTKVKQGG